LALKRLRAICRNRASMRFLKIMVNRALNGAESEKQEYKKQVSAKKLLHVRDEGLLILIPN